MPACIVMPPQGWFAEQSNWYATVLHGLVHVSGAPQRLNRAVGAYWSSEYAFEEQVHADQIAARIVRSVASPTSHPRGSSSVAIPNTWRVPP